MALGHENVPEIASSYHNAQLELGTDWPSVPHGMTVAGCSAVICGDMGIFASRRGCVFTFHTICTVHLANWKWVEDAKVKCQKLLGSDSGKYVSKGGKL